MSKEALEGAKKKGPSRTFTIFAKKDYTSAVHTHFWAGSNFNSFANCVPSMTNDGTLESSHRGEVVLGPLTGGTYIDTIMYKNNNLVQDKQTVLFQ